MYLSLELGHTTKKAGGCQGDAQSIVSMPIERVVRFDLRADSPKQFSGFDLQGFGELHDCDEGEISLASLDCPNERNVQSRRAGPQAGAQRWLYSYCVVSLLSASIISRAEKLATIQKRETGAYCMLGQKGGRHPSRIARVRSRHFVQDVARMV
jgi:hypothetical protein